MRLTRNLRFAERKRELRGVSLRGPYARCRIALAPKTAPFLSLNLHRAIAPLSQKLLDLELGEDLPVHATHLAARSRVPRSRCPSPPCSSRFSSRPARSEGFKPLRRPTGRNPTKLTNAKLVRGFGNTRSRSHSRSAPSSPTVVVASSISPSNSVPCHLPRGSTADRCAQVYSTSLSPPAQAVCLFFRDLSVMGRAKRPWGRSTRKIYSRGAPHFPRNETKKCDRGPNGSHHFPSESNGSCHETEKISAQKYCESDQTCFVR